MKPDYDKGKVILDLCDILRSIDGQAKVELIDSLSCEEEVVKHVSDIITTRWTEMASSPLSSCQMESEPSTAMDRAVREVAKRSGQTAKDEIERLERALANQELRIAKMQKEIEEFHNQRRY